jgi:hypothetical protein
MQEIVRSCLADTGAGRISDHAEELVLLGLVYSPVAAISRKQHRLAMKRGFKAKHPEMGSVFLVFILPILVSVISAWITKWILNRKDLGAIQTAAARELTALSQSTKATPTSTNTPRT